MVKHYYERNCVDIKEEFTSYLLSKLSPLIYEGFVSIYEQSLLKVEKIDQEIKKNPTHKNPGVEKIFRAYLRDIKNLNSNLIRDETIQIRSKSEIPELFDDLVKAVVKSNIVLLTFNASEKTSYLVLEKRHEQIDIEKFIHLCYLECAPIFYIMPHMLRKVNESNDELYNQYLVNRKDCLEKINKCIKNAIRLISPMKEILTEYLKNDYINEKIDHNYKNLKNMLYPQNNNNNDNNDHDKNMFNDNDDDNDEDDDDEDDDEDDEDDDNNDNSNNNENNNQVIMGNDDNQEIDNDLRNMIMDDKDNKDNKDNKEPFNSDKKEPFNNEKKTVTIDFGGTRRSGALALFDEALKNQASKETQL